MLLTAGDMPSGWSVDPHLSAAGSGCFKNWFSPPGDNPSAQASVAFVANVSKATLGEELATYATPASGVFATLVATLDQCKTLKGTTDGQKITGTIRPISLPRYGDQSATFGVILRFPGFSYYADILIVRKGPVMAGFVQSSYGSSELGQFERLVQRALPRIS